MASPASAEANTKVGGLPRLPAIAGRQWLPIVVAVVGGLVLVAAATAILTLELGTDRPVLSAGEVAETTILAPRRATYVSQVQTRALREAAAAQVGDYSDYDSSLLRRLRTNATEALSAVSDVRKAGHASSAERQRQIAALIPNLSAGTVALMAELPDADWLAVTAETLRILDNHVGQRIHGDELADVQGQAIASINQSLSSDQIAVVSALVREYIQENLIYNAEATEEARQQARDAVQPVTATVELSEVIVRAGETLTEDDVEALKALGLSRRPLRFGFLLGTALYVGLLVGLFLYYVSIFQPVTFSHPLHVTGLLVSIVIPLFVTKLILPTAHWAVYAIPLATGAMVLSSLLAPRLALVWSVTTVLLLAPLYNGNLELITLSVTTTVAGALGARRIERMHTFFVAGLLVAVSGLVIVVAFRLLHQDYDLIAMTPLVLATLGNGALAAVLTLGISGLAGILFGATTTMQLLEWAHPGQTLLRRLALEAPGTFHHSMLVANLAEQAAERIGGNPLLARVGAYYHDIGKLHRPYYFIENQMDGENIHDHLGPQESALAIIEHRSKGLALGRQHRLPRRIQSFISEHHGDTCMQYFYRRAVEDNGHPPVSEDQFRYPGPKPQTKETALVMLADSAEAAVRSATTAPTATRQSAQSIEELVIRVVDERVLEGQLDDSALTLQDIKSIKRTLTQQLQGIYHPRIEYPKATTAPAKLPSPDAERAADG